MPARRNAAQRAESLPIGRRQAPKADRWPRAGRRQARVRSVLTRRQPDLTVVLENIHDPHNVSAMLRTCDAVGVLCAHAVYTIEEPPPGAFARQTSASAAKWVDVVRHESVEACYGALRAAGFRILVASLEPGARRLYEWDLVAPSAIVLGNEMRGVSTSECAFHGKLSRRGGQPRSLSTASCPRWGTTFERAGAAQMPAVTLQDVAARARHFRG